MEWILKKEKIILIVIALWVAVVSLWHFETNPPYWFDEGLYHQVVRSLNDTGERRLQLSPDRYDDTSLFSIGYPVFYPAVLAFTLFGDSVAVLRLTAIVFLWAFLAAAYLLARNLYGVKNALASLALLALFSPLYGNGKTFLGEVPGMFYFVAGLALFTYAEEKQKSWRNRMMFFASGLFLGMAAASKPNFLVILPAVFLGAVWKWREFFGDRETRFNTLFTILGGMIALLYWFVTQFGLTARADQIFAHYSNPYYIENIMPVVLANIKRFFTESTPLHFLFLFCGAGFALVLKAARRHSLRFSEIAIMAFASAIIIFYVRTAGWYRYFFPAHLVIFILFPAALEYIGKAFFRFSDKKNNIFWLSVIVILGLAQLQVMRTERFKTGLDAPAEFDSYLAALNPDESVFFYNLPQLAARYHSKNFYQLIKASEQLSFGADNLALLAEGRFHRVIMEDKPVDFIVPDCYSLEAVIRKITVYKRNEKNMCR